MQFLAFTNLKYLWIVIVWSLTILVTVKCKDLKNLFYLSLTIQKYYIFRKLVSRRVCTSIQIFYRPTISKVIKVIKLAKLAPNIIRALNN